MPKPPPKIKSALVPRGTTPIEKILTARDDRYLSVILYKNGGEAEKKEKKKKTLEKKKNKVEFI